MSGMPQLFLPWLLPKLLGAVYCVAFSSLLPQVLGLYGSRGIVPLAEGMQALKESYGRAAYRLCPSLFFTKCSDRILLGSCILGVVLSLLLLVVDGLSAAIILLLLYVLYLSFTSAGEEFLRYQWDALLLEAGFMTIFLPLVTAAPPLVVFTYRFFIFRFIFSSGMVKLLSGDRTWRDLTALSYHYQTQPLPNRVAWYVHQMPLMAQKGSTLATLALELAVPFLALGPAPARVAGFVLLTLLQLLIFITGNYGFFNLLTIALIMPLLDDGIIGRFLTLRAGAGDLVPAAAVNAIFAIFLLLNLCQMAALFYRPRWLSKIFVALSPFNISNHYGLFAVMTTRRFEFVVEGSKDEKQWLTYKFRWKPGDPGRAPNQAAPHQPRLDWQMWFAALDPRTLEPWLHSLVLRLLEGSPPVLKLFKHNPFPDDPPDFIRLTVYSYRFSDLATKKSEGVWWVRQRIGQFPHLSLKPR